MTTPSTTTHSPLVKGIRTAVQAIVGIVIGYIVFIWAVPGVPAATIQYISSNIVPLLVTAGLPSGLVAFAWNYFEQRVQKSSN
ncbi:hypothetical protein [Cryobacterium sp. GrIS_2_6]|uniref:hypothetical protein n=1 Tax=Cryobacterium sp. GrIS_2_6 TaxID=3162785 RepID=UPI002E0559C2|nr:hypothetical protein [Cryobacterium psychrotolerans]